MTVERALGWWMACTIHPHAAWRVLRRRERALLVGIYFGASYIAALILLLAR